MKVNKWTLGLAAVGVVSLASITNAEEKSSSVMTALSSTTLSGYVDTSAQWNFGTGNENMPPYKFGVTSKADGFNLNVVQLRIEKPLDEAEWAAGYRVDLWAGPDANTLNTQSTGPGTGSDFAVRQAYVALRAPLGNGLDFKVGVFDSILGYESVESPSNPNFTRSYGHSIEPQTHTGFLATYRFSEHFTLSGGVANTVGPTINERANPPKAESYKTYMGSIALTAPDNWGALAGSTLYGGVVNGFKSNASEGAPGNTTSVYAGATVATPVAGLRVGAAYDAYWVHDYGTVNGENHGNAWAAGGYASYQATEKMSLHGRVEYIDDSADLLFDSSEFGNGTGYRAWEFTGTIQYDLWKNVISRLEFRWDYGENGQYFGAPNTETEGGSRRNAYLLALNIIYKF
jgi:hypothetical protein